MSALLRISNGTVSAHGGPPLTDADVTRFVLDTERHAASAAFRSSWDWTTPRTVTSYQSETHPVALQTSNHCSNALPPQQKTDSAALVNEEEPDFEPDIHHRHHLYIPFPFPQRRHEQQHRAQPQRHPSQHQGETSGEEQYFTTVDNEATVGNKTPKSLYAGVSSVHLAAQGLKLSPFMLLVPFLLKAAHLRVLSLPHNFLGDEGVRVLAQCIEAQMHCLRILDIANNDVSPSGCVDIARAFFRQLSDDTTSTNSTTTNTDYNVSASCHSIDTLRCTCRSSSMVVSDENTPVEGLNDADDSHLPLHAGTKIPQCTKVSKTSHQQQQRCDYCRVHQHRQTAAQFRLHSDDDLDGEGGTRAPARIRSGSAGVALSEILCLDISDNPIGLDGCFDLAEAIRLSKRFVHLSVRNVSLESAAGVFVFASCLSQLFALDMSGNTLEYAGTSALESFSTRLHQTWSLTSSCDALLPKVSRNMSCVYEGECSSSQQPSSSKTPVGSAEQSEGSGEGKAAESESKYAVLSDGADSYSDLTDGVGHVQAESTGKNVDDEQLIVGGCGNSELAAGPVDSIGELAVAGSSSGDSIAGCSASAERIANYNASMEIATPSASTVGSDGEAYGEPALSKDSGLCHDAALHVLANDAEITPRHLMETQLSWLTSCSTYSPTYDTMRSETPDVDTGVEFRSRLLAAASSLATLPIGPLVLPPNSALLIVRNLSSLGLAGNDLEDTHLAALCEALSDSSCVLQELDLAFNAIADASPLADVVAHHRWLRMIDLSHNALTDSSVVQLADAAASNLRVEELALGCNAELGPNCVRAFAALLSEQAAAMQQIAQPFKGSSLSQLPHAACTDRASEDSNPCMRGLLHRCSSMILNQGTSLEDFPEYLPSRQPPRSWLITEQVSAAKCQPFSDSTQYEVEEPLMDEAHSIAGKRKQRGGRSLLSKLSLDSQSDFLKLTKRRTIFSSMNTKSFESLRRYESSPLDHDNSDNSTRTAALAKHAAQSNASRHRSSRLRRRAVLLGHEYQLCLPGGVTGGITRFPGLGLRFLDLAGCSIDDASLEALSQSIDTAYCPLQYLDFRNVRGLNDVSRLKSIIAGRTAVTTLNCQSVTGSTVQCQDITKMLSCRSLEVAGLLRPEAVFLHLQDVDTEDEDEHISKNDEEP